MNLKEYQQRALETAKFPVEQALPYCSLGLCGEIAELFEYLAVGRTINLDAEVAELGDVAWYCAVLAHYAGIELLKGADDYLMPVYHDSYVDGMAMHAGMIANKVKKQIRDGKAPDTAFMEARIGAILRLLHEYSRAIRVPFDIVLERNVAKLADRKARGVIGGSGDKR